MGSVLFVVFALAAALPVIGAARLLVGGLPGGGVAAEAFMAEHGRDQGQEEDENT